LIKCDPFFTASSTEGSYAWINQNIIQSDTYLLAIAGQTTVWVVSHDTVSGSHVISVVHVTEKRNFTGVKE